MHDLITWLRDYGDLVIFVAVFIERAGPPLPAFPLIVIAAGASPDAASLIRMSLLAIAASMFADVGWYVAGKRYGSRILSLLCRISISPDSCVSQTQAVFNRWGALSLLASKFIPGLATMAPPLAGVVRQPLMAFLFYDTLGSLIWCGAAVALGYVFRNAVDDVLQTLVHFGSVGALAIVGAIGIYLAYKWFQRYSMIRSLRMERITVEELRELIASGAAPVIIDARPKELQEIGFVIPGALTVSPDSLGALAERLVVATDVVIYCACPNEASAAKIALQLKGLGVKRIRPLKGGIEAWLAAG